MAFPTVTPEDVDLDTSDLLQLMETVTGWVDEQKPVGAELHVIRNGKTVLHEARGFQDRESRRPLRQLRAL